MNNNFLKYIKKTQENQHKTEEIISKYIFEHISEYIQNQPFTLNSFSDYIFISTLPYCYHLCSHDISNGKHSDSLFYNCMNKNNVFNPAELELLSYINTSKIAMQLKGWSVTLLGLLAFAIEFGRFDIFGTIAMYPMGVQSFLILRYLYGEAMLSPLLIETKRIKRHFVLSIGEYLEEISPEEMFGICCNIANSLENSDYSDFFCSEGVIINLDPLSLEGKLISEDPIVKKAMEIGYFMFKSYVSNSNYENELKCLAINTNNYINNYISEEEFELYLNDIENKYINNSQISKKSNKTRKR